MSSALVPDPGIPWPDLSWTPTENSFQAYLAGCPPNSTLRKYFASYNSYELPPQLGHNKTQHGVTRIWRDPPSQSTAKLTENDTIFNYKISAYDSSDIPIYQLPQEPVLVPDVHIALDDLKSFHFEETMHAGKRLRSDHFCFNRKAADQEGLFYSDFRMLHGWYPVFSPASMPGFQDIMIPVSCCCSSTQIVLTCLFSPVCVPYFLYDVMLIFC